jgi:8-amino-7-oxononanoate synthase
LIDRADILSELQALDAAGLRRRMRPIDGPQAAEVQVDGRSAINFSSNNYLGLADDPLLGHAASVAIEEHGFGAGASRLIAGSLKPHRALEQEVAAWMGAEAALLFNSGYQANVGLVSALVGSEDVVFSDRLNHASLIDGCRLSRAKVEVFRHRDLDHLRFLLQTCPGRRRLIVTDTIFSMDGNRADLDALVEIAQRHEAILAVDEAHALGVLGERGTGLSRDLPIDLRMGTFGKALGGFGAFVVGGRGTVELLQHRARSFVFTTALPVPVVAAARAAVRWLAGGEGARRRSQLSDNIAYFCAELTRRGILATPRSSHIVPLRVKDGEPRRAMQASDALLERGVFAQGIRPPTVPNGTARIRFALMATHTRAHLDRGLSAIAALAELFE